MDKDGQNAFADIEADVDFAKEKAHMSYGDIGIKVWFIRNRKKNKPCFSRKR